MPKQDYNDPFARAREWERIRQSFPQVQRVQDAVERARDEASRVENSRVHMDDVASAARFISMRGHWSTGVGEAVSLVLSTLEAIAKEDTY